MLDSQAARTAFDRWLSGMVPVVHEDRARPPLQPHEVILAKHGDIPSRAHTFPSSPRYGGGGAHVDMLMLLLSLTRRMSSYVLYVVNHLLKMRFDKRSCQEVGAMGAFRIVTSWQLRVLKSIT